jgi:hypothetical protein
MPTFDSVTLRKAVAEFTPDRPQKFQELIPAKEVIAELRQKRASYRAIAELLTQHCLPTSKTAIAVFCHELLGEIVRPHRRTGRRRPTVSASTGLDGCDSAPPRPTGGSPKEQPPANSNGGEKPQTHTHGPRIAQVRMLTPKST